MFASISYQHVTKLHAHAFADLSSAPLIIELRSATNETDMSHGEIVIHMQDATLATALAEAINRTVAEHEAKSEQQEAA